MISNNLDVSNQTKEILKKKREIQRKKKQVAEDFDRVLLSIQTKKWKFSEVRMWEQNSKIRWECADKSGIKITGSVERLFTKVMFEFERDKIDVTAEAERVEKLLLSDEQKKRIEDWRKDSEEKRKEIQEKYEKGRTSYKNASKQSIHRENEQFSNEKVKMKCVYCGKATIYGSICGECIERYQKKRHGIGGYPAYDPNARGSNLLKYETSKKK